MSLQTQYKQEWDNFKATGYQLNQEYIPLISGRKGRDIVSDVRSFNFCFCSPLSVMFNAHIIIKRTSGSF